MHGTKYSQAELETKLWAAANALRGPVDADKFKDYIFPLLFFKRISDTWEWEHAQALERYDGNEDLAGLAENYRFVIPRGCLWEDVLKLPENVGAGLQKILDRIQEANPDTLAGIFGTVQWANKEQLPEHALRNVLDIFTSLELDPESVSHDILGNAYEYLLKNFADETGKKAGEFFTPRSVVRLMARILEPQSGESVCDPACGSGGLLVESVNEVREAGGDPRTLRLYGQEISPTTAAIAKMNLFLHDIETFRIARCDTLRDPKLREPSGELMKFDVVVANPPFALKNWGREQWADDPFGRAEFGVPPAGYAEYAFVEHMLTILKSQTGRLAVVMPRGVLFRGGAEAGIRQALIDKHLIDAVIGLPSNLFYNTTIPGCILVCRGPGASRHATGDILFIDASGAFEKTGARNEMRPDHVDAVVQAYRTEQTPGDEGGVAVRRVPLDLIREGGYDLNVGRYLDTGDADELDFGDALDAYLVSKDALSVAQADLDLRLRAAGLVE